MIIDKILDRRAGIVYNPKQFYNEMTMYGVDSGFAIASALDSGEEVDVKRALAIYIIENEYNLDIINYIYQVNWLK
jgi:hypothetical protein